jgi:hypothetical protein
MLIGLIALALVSSMIALGGWPGMRARATAAPSRARPALVKERVVLGGAARRPVRGSSPRQDR